MKRRRGAGSPPPRGRGHTNSGATSAHPAGRGKTRGTVHTEPVAAPTGDRASGTPSAAPAPSAGTASLSSTRFHLAIASDANNEALLGPDFPEGDWSERAVLANVVVVRVGDGTRTLECESGDIPLRRGQPVVVETERGLEIGSVVTPARRRLVETRLARVQRSADDADLALEADNRRREAEAVRAARDAVHSLGLRAKVVQAEAGLGASRITVVLAAEERVELRELGRRLTTALRRRVELRVVGLRDAAKLIGGVGPCGLQLCCNTFLADFAPVSIRMAKDQGLALNPQRVSGVCGRLMCCLVYEEAYYRAQRSLFPRPGRRVHTEKGMAVVRDVDVLARTVRVVYPDGTQQTYDVGDVGPARGNGPGGAQGPTA